MTVAKITTFVLTLLAVPALTPAMQAGPVQCTTTLEAPMLDAAATQAYAPVEVTYCTELISENKLIEDVHYGWTAPFTRGVGLVHQISDLFGIAIGGREGNKLMGLGFADQTINWDGAALFDRAKTILDLQANPMLLRTADLPGMFSTSLGSSRPTPRWRQPVIEPQEDSPIRGLW